jgi:hypothetical protein
MRVEASNQKELMLDSKEKGWPSFHLGGHWDKGLPFFGLRPISKRKAHLIFASANTLRAFVVMCANRTTKSAFTHNDSQSVSLSVTTRFISQTNRWLFVSILRHCISPSVELRHYFYYTVLPTTRKGKPSNTSNRIRRAVNLFIS